MNDDLERECFFIAPIGDKDSDVRKRSDGVRDWVVRPAAEVHGLRILRADDVGEPGQITAQAIQHCLQAKAAVADLTGGNPNVYYELSVRHGAQLPVVLIAEEGTKLPFDISQSRVIFFDHTDLASAGEARERLEAQIGASLSGPPDNPISDGMRLAQLKGGDAEGQTLAMVVDRLQRLSGAVEQLDEHLRSNGDAAVKSERHRLDTQSRSLVGFGSKLRELLEAYESDPVYRDKIEKEAAEEGMKAAEAMAEKMRRDRDS